MIKRILSGAVKLLPQSLGENIRESYWQVKSAILYKYLYQVLNLEYRLQSGIRVRVASLGEWWTYNDIFVNHEYDLAIRAGLSSRLPERPFVVLDLGANVGFFILRVADVIAQSEGAPLACEITAVEGSPRNFRVLRRRIESQPLSHVQCRFVHGLVGQRSGEGVIRESALHVKNTIMKSPRLPGARVDFVNLADVMADHEHIDLLKCDIEGAELSFIENYPDLLRRVKHAVLELHHGLCDTTKCVRLLLDLGFSQKELRANEEVSICLFSRCDQAVADDRSMAS